MKMGIFSQQKSSTLFPSSDWHGSFGFKLVTLLPIQVKEYLLLLLILAISFGKLF